MALLVPQVAFAQTSTTTSSSPSATTIALGRSITDTATVTGGVAPTGAVDFSICGPLTSASGCTSGGTSVGSASLNVAVPATATSASFAPGAPGIWCFAAHYRGDTLNAPSSDDSSDECFTVTAPGAPTATIASPTDNAIYSVGQAVSASYDCTEGSGGPGIASCSGTNVNGAPIDTSTLGAHTFTVTGQSRDGLSTTVSVRYKVAGPPSATISSPRNGDVYTLGQLVGVSFSCSEGQFGSGLAGCSSPSAVNTSKLGTQAFSVTASSMDGQQSTSTVHFTVVVASNKFSVTRLVALHNGTVTFIVKVPGGGTIQVVEIAPNSALPKPVHGSFVFARLRLKTQGKKTVHVAVNPNLAGKALMRDHSTTVSVRLVVTYTPINGKPRSHTFGGLRVSPYATGPRSP